MGAEHLYLYNMNVSDRVDTLFKYYTSRGVLTVYRYPENKLTQGTWYHGQDTAIYDCFLRNEFTSAWVLLQDMDEFVVSLHAARWPELLQSVVSQSDHMTSGTDQL